MNNTNKKKKDKRAIAGTYFAQKNKSVEKYFRDPIHDLIKVDSSVTLNLIGTSPMQRLRRLRQLGLASYVYPGADHSRFSHSLGVYHLARRLLDQLHVRNKYDRFVILNAALLHDIGHGPMSHVFEDFLDRSGYTATDERNHEDWSRRIIRESSEIKKCFKKYSTSLVSDIHMILANVYYKENLHGIVVSQFDADRLDYMLRDSYMTGVSYGKCDLEWLLRCLTIEKLRLPGQKEKIVVDVSRGMSVLEGYFIGNLYLYKHVYFHKTIQVVNSMVQNVMLRCVELIKQGIATPSPNVAFQKLANNLPLSIDDYCTLDDGVIMSWIERCASESKDSCLRDLSSRIRNRNLFKARSLSAIDVENHEAVFSEIRATVKKKRLDPNYYFHVVSPRREAYNITDLNEVYIKKDANSPPQRYSTLGAQKKDHSLSYTISRLFGFSEKLVVFPEQVEEKVENIIKSYEEESLR